MKSCLKPSFAFLFVSLAFTSIAQAGGGGSSVHGGSVVVCRNSEGRLLSAELTDIFDAKARKVRLKNEQASEEILVNEALRTAQGANASYGYRLGEVVAQVRKMTVFLQVERQIVPIGDLGEANPVEAGCTYEQLGAFHDGMLLVDSDLFEALSPLSRAAFLIHEGVYMIARNGAFAENSHLSRVLTGLLFAEKIGREELQAAIRPIFLEPQGGTFFGDEGKLSLGCKIDASFADETAAAIELYFTADENISGEPCPWVKKTIRLTLDPFTGSYGDLIYGTSVYFVGSVYGKRFYLSRFRPSSDEPRGGFAQRAP